MRLPQVSPRLYRNITIVVLAAVVFIVITGAAVRLTGSGLGCSDWPTCEQNQLVAPAQYHPMIEFVNRMITGLVSVAVIAAVLGSLVRRPRRKDLIWWSVGLVVGIVAQIVLGGITVLFDLYPPLVMSHFLLSALLVANAVILMDRASHAGTRGVATVPAALVNVGRVLVLGAFTVLITGTVVTGTGPHGGDERVRRLPFIVEDVTRIHSVTAIGFCLVAVAALAMLYRSGASVEARRRGAWLVAVILGQGAIGYTQYFLHVPPALVLLHVTGAVVVWVVALRFYLGLWAHPAAAEEPSTTAAATDGATVSAGAALPAGLA